MDYKKMTKAELLETLERLEKTRRGSGETPDLSVLVEELHIQQVELEMQNQELRDTHLEVENTLERYQSLFDFAPVAYFTFDMKGVIAEVNLAAQELLNLKREECIGKPFSDFIAPGHVREWLAHLRQAFLAKEQLVTELPLEIHGQGVTMQVLSLGMTVPGQEVKLLRSAMIDVTERRKIERQLQESEERYRRLFYPISEAVLLVDQGNGTIIDNNAAAITLYGYNARQLIGMNVANLFMNQEQCRSILESHSRQDLILQQRKQSGEMFPAEVSVYRFIHRGLVVAGITVRDMTGQHRKEESRRRSDGLFQAAVRNMPVFFAVYNRERQYRFVNATAESWLQRPSADLCGKLDEESVPDDITKGYLPLLTEAIQTKSLKAGKCIFRTKDGTVEAYMKFVPLLDEEGAISQIVALGVEVGEIARE